MAQRLVHDGCPAVVAMQFPFSEGAAGTFVKPSTARSPPAARPTVPPTSPGGLLGEHPAEWNYSVLFMRCPDGRIFERVGQ